MKNSMVFVCALVALAFTLSGLAPHAAHAGEPKALKSHVTKLTDSELQELRDASDNGNDKAALQLYYYYEFVKSDKRQSMGWLKTAASKGSDKARRMLGQLCALSGPECR